MPALIERLREQPKPDWLVPVIASWLAVRCLVAIAYLGVRVGALNSADGELPYQATRKLLSWDGGHYRFISQIGYDQVDIESVRFFPAFPMLARLLSPLVGGSDTAAVIVLTNVAALGALIAMYRLVRFETGDHNAATWSVWAFALFPAGFVASWAYAEPMMLWFSLAAMLSLRKSRYGSTAVLLFFAGLTRPLGSLMAFPVAVEIWRERRDLNPRRWAGATAALVAGPVGSGVYVLWASLHFNDWLVPLTIQSELRGEPSSPPQRFVEGIGELFSDPLGDGVHVLFLIAFCGLTILVARWLPASYTALTVATLVIAMGAENLNSFERYGYNAFPLAIAAGLAMWRFPRVRAPALGTGAALIVAFSAAAWWGSYVP
jgi:Gpi18-like mannosyltransferase